MTINDTGDTIWKKYSNKLIYPIQIDPCLYQEFYLYFKHRYRELLLFHRSFLIPSSYEINPYQISFEYHPSNLISDINQIQLHHDIKTFNDWQILEFLPVLRSLIKMSEDDDLYDVEFFPYQGLLIPPVSFFLRDIKPNQKRIEKFYKGLLPSWINYHVSYFDHEISTEERSIIDRISKLIGKNDWVGINKEIMKEGDNEPFSFMNLLTEGEFFSKIAQIYRYSILKKEEAAKYGFTTHSRLCLEIDRKYPDKHFGKITRPTPQELWDRLLLDSRSSKWLAVTPMDSQPNPFLKASSATEMIEWTDVHKDQAIIVVDSHKKYIPKNGYLFVYDHGEIDQILKKKRLLKFWSNNQSLKFLFNIPYKERSDKQNNWKRDELEQRILDSKGIFAVQGPPGTGKTYLATRVITQHLTENPFSRILVCAKEHLALDHILKTVVKNLGHRQISFHAFRSISKARLTRTDIDEDIKDYIASKKMEEIGQLAWESQHTIWERLSDTLLSEYDLRNRSLAESIVHIYFCTTMDSAFYSLIENHRFDLVIIEEAGKCYPSELFHAMCMGHKILLIGDQNQLPPYQEKETIEGVRNWELVLEKAIKQHELEEHLRTRFGPMLTNLVKLYRNHGPIKEIEMKWLRPFEYIFSVIPRTNTHTLEEQYRMEPELSNVIARVFYNRNFINKKTSKHPLKKVLPNRLDKPLIWIDTPHITEDPDAGEDPEKIGIQVNHYEIELIKRYLNLLTTETEIDIVILTPYNDQKYLMINDEKLENMLRAFSNRPIDEIIRTIDEYQGHEADLTIISLVRNNTLGSKSSWGFMTEPERLNVMFSRTKERQVIIGCSEHIKRNRKEPRITFLLNFLNAYKEEGGVFISSEEFDKYE